MKYIDKLLPPITCLSDRDEYYGVFNRLINTSSLYNALKPENHRILSTTITESYLLKCLDSISYREVPTSVVRTVRSRVSRFTQDLNLHYELLQLLSPNSTTTKEEKAMPTGITLTEEETRSPLSTIQVCAGRRLDEMSESDMVHHLNNFQQRIDKLKALKVTSKKIKTSIKTLEEQLESLVEAYDII
jgi:hypothetical protein